MKRKKTSKTLGVLLAFFCITFQLSGQEYLKDSTIYKEAIQDAMYPDASKVYNKLWAVDQSNKKLIWKEVNGETYLLTVVWMRAKYIDNYRPFVNWGFYNTGEWPMWVTIAPELIQRMKEEKSKNKAYRLKQMLGLSPAATYDYFIEIWVKPSDLIRPCPDPETTDTKCDVCFPKGVDSTHINWINQNRISSYYNCDLFNQVPWTALGYTYDWNPKNKKHIGLSEFIIPANTNVVIKKIYTNQEYLN